MSILGVMYRSRVKYSGGRRNRRIWPPLREDEKIARCTVCQQLWRCWGDLTRIESGGFVCGDEAKNCGTVATLTDEETADLMTALRGALSQPKKKGTTEKRGGSPASAQRSLLDVGTGGRHVYQEEDD